MALKLEKEIESHLTVQESTKGELQNIQQIIICFNQSSKNKAISCVEFALIG